MSAVEVRMVKVNNAEGTFVDPFSFEVTYEAYRELPHDLEWQIIYVGSAGSDNSEEFDQTLENVLVGPVKPGTHRFQFPAPAPDPAKIPKQELLGVTIVLLTCSYKNQEFVRIGYYVANSVPGQQVVRGVCAFGHVPGAAGPADNLFSALRGAPAVAGVQAGVPLAAAVASLRRSPVLDPDAGVPADVHKQHRVRFLWPFCALMRPRVHARTHRPTPARTHAPPRPPRQTAVPAAARGRMIGAEDDTPPPETEDGEEEDDEDEEEDDDISMEPEAEVPVPADLRLVTRRILADKPRVTKFPIDWDV